MGLGRKLLGAARPAWFLLVAAATIAVYSGNAEPLVSPSQVPRGALFMFGAPALALVVGWLLVGLLEGSLEKGAWRKAGRTAGLTPADGSSPAGRPTLTGSVGGRAVHARTQTEVVVRSGEDASTRRTYTFVEADLGGPAEEALVVVPAGGGEISAGGTTVRIDRMLGEVADGELTVVEEEGLTFLGTGAPVVEAVRSSPASSAIRGLEEVNMVYVGDVGPALSKLFPDADAEGGSLGGWMQGAMVGEAEDAIAQRVPDDPSSASLESLGVVEDGDRLRQQAQAVAALAEAFDEAAEPSSPRPPDPEP